MGAPGGAVGLAERYASALLDVAVEKNFTLDEVSIELSLATTLTSENGVLTEVLSAPRIPLENRLKVLEELFSLGKFSAITRNLLRLLTKRERISLLTLIVEEFQRLLLEHKGVQRGEVRSAFPMTETQKETLAESLGAVLSKKMELSYSIDPLLVGGVVVRIGNLIYDASVVTQLKHIKENTLSSI